MSVITSPSRASNRHSASDQSAQNPQHPKIILLDSRQSLVDAVVDHLFFQNWHSIVLPSLFVLQSVRTRWMKRHGQGILPKMVTYVHPMGYTTPSVLKEKPVSLGQGVLWTLDFLHTHFSENFKNIQDHGIPDEVALKEPSKKNPDHADLAGFARSLLHLWEHLDRHFLYEKPDPLAIMAWGKTGFSLPESLIQEVYGSGTPQIVQQWLKWWPQWLHRHRLCSQTRASFLAQEHTVQWWKEHPTKNILLGIQHIEKMPWNWLKNTVALPNVSVIMPDEPLYWDSLGISKDDFSTIHSKSNHLYQKIFKQENIHFSLHNNSIKRDNPCNADDTVLQLNFLHEGKACSIEHHVKIYDDMPNGDNIPTGILIEENKFLSDLKFQNKTNNLDIQNSELFSSVISLSSSVLSLNQNSDHFADTKDTEGLKLSGYRKSKIKTLDSSEACLQTGTELNQDLPQRTYAQDIVCENAIEQARVIAVLVVEALKNPHALVGLVIPCPTVLAHTSHALKYYDIHLPMGKIPLVATLLHILWRGSFSAWKQQDVLILLRHPLILKRYPIAESMALWIERYAPPWPPKIGVTFSEIIPETIGSERKNPRWLHRLHRTLYRAIGDLTNAIATSLEEKTPRLAAFWMDAHLHALEYLVPAEFWDNHAIIEKILQEKWSILPEITLEIYGHWMFFLTSNLVPICPLGHPRIVMGSSEDLECVILDRCIIALNSEVTLFPWMPQSWNDFFHLQDKPIQIIPKQYFCQPSSGANLESIKGDLWLVSHHATPTPSIYRQHAKKLLHHPLLWNTRINERIKKTLDRPAPPLMSISISDLQRWKSNTQAFYHERILCIRDSALSDQQIWGMAMHKLLDHFIRDFTPKISFSLNQLHTGLCQLACVFLPVMPWWQEAARDRLLYSIAECEYKHRQNGVCESVTEQKGKETFSVKNGSIVLVGRADRIDYLADGTAHIIDYKTGEIPSFVALERMESIQLPLEGLMVQSGSMGKKCMVSKLSWWSLHLTKGCQVKTYPRCVQKLLDPYAQILPKWLDIFASGSY